MVTRSFYSMRHGVRKGYGRGFYNFWFANVCVVAEKKHG